MCGIYKIENIIDGKIYIGSSKNIELRWHQHKYCLYKNKHHSILLQRAWNKYGKENFEFSVVEECSEEDLLIREQYYLDLYKSYDRNIGYNISITANGGTVQEQYKKYGEDCYTCIYSENVIKQVINEMLENKKSYHQIAKEYNIPMATIYALKNKHAWRKLVRDINFPKPLKETRENVKLNTKEVLEIIELLISGKTNNDICELYRVNPKTISDIRNHKTWRELTDGIDFIRSPRSSQLTTLQKSIVDYYENNKCSYDEISQILNCSTSQVCAALKRNRKLNELKGEIN